LNRYLYPDAPNYDVDPADPQFDLLRRMPIYECPSDSGGFWGSSSDPDSRWRSEYWQFGSSYTINYHFVLNWAFYRAQVLPSNPWLHLSNAYVRVQLRSNAARFVVLFEDPFDSALYLRMPRRGWHRRWNMHSLMFLDGHAANMKTDTAKDTSGLGWKTGSGNSPVDVRAWWNYRFDPDYQYRDLTPLPGN
jgi:hypothetical protein